MNRWLGVLCLLCSAAQAADLGGRIRLGGSLSDSGSQSLDSALGHRSSEQADAQLRLTASRAMGNWSLEAAWQLDGRYGSAVALERDKVQAFPELAPEEDDSYWNMQHSWKETQYSDIRQRWDRLSLGYTKDALVLRAGRQALTWGSGQVFHPMDLVNPFQPVQLDTAYKRGTDMLYAQWLFDSGADVQFVVVPHTGRNTSDANGDKPTQALYASIPGDTFQWTILAASDRTEPVFGLGINGPLGENLWNVEVISTRLDGGGYANSLLANLTRAGIIWQGNYRAFIEFYHNGFGQSSVSWR